jgi:hypothetical protein
MPKNSTDIKNLAAKQIDMTELMSVAPHPSIHEIEELQSRNGIGKMEEARITKAIDDIDVATKLDIDTARDETSKMTGRTN